MARAKGMMIRFMFLFWFCLQSNLLEFAKTGDRLDLLLLDVRLE